LGGDEFLIILPESDLQTAYNIADKIRQNIAHLEIVFAGKSIAVTISIGVACMSASDTAETLINHADEALYIAKNKGRNRVQKQTVREKN
jgi:diguanylate cyclase (GGDEF)-like protein